MMKGRRTHIDEREEDDSLPEMTLAVQVHLELGRVAFADDGVLPTIACTGVDVRVWLP